MRRLFWVALGATAGVVAVRRATTAARRLTPAGMSESLQGAGLRGRAAAGGFLDAVAQHAAEREVELRAALGLDGGGSAAPAGGGR